MPEQLLAALGAVAGLRECLERTEGRLVARSRQTGLSWAVIGDAWGELSRQGAHNRYRRRPNPAPAPASGPQRPSAAHKPPVGRGKRPPAGSRGSQRLSAPLPALPPPLRPLGQTPWGPGPR